jgi:hypothetical protein
VNPTIYSEGPYRFFFFSREEPRPHVPVISSNGEAKFWLEPVVALADSEGLNLNSAVKEDENGADTRKHKGF